MDAKAAVELAKATVADLFGKEGVINLGLEELEFDDARDLWRITVGFSRSRDAQGVLALTGAIRRTYKIVVIDKDGKAVSVKNREMASVN